MQASETPEVAKDERNIAEIKCKISNHILYFDVLTILASFAVVAMHVNSAYWSYRNAPSWVLNLIIEKTCVWAVPVCFMLTGATLIDYRKRHSTSEYVKRRVRRTVVPFLIWSFVGLFFSLLIQNLRHEVTSWWWPVVGIPIIYIVTILIVFYSREFRC